MISSFDKHIYHHVLCLGIGLIPDSAPLVSVESHYHGLFLYSVRALNSDNEYPSIAGRGKSLQLAFKRNNIDVGRLHSICVEMKNTAVGNSSLLNMANYGTLVTKVTGTSSSFSDFKKTIPLCLSQ